MRKLIMARSQSFECHLINFERFERNYSRKIEKCGKAGQVNDSTYATDSDGQMGQIQHTSMKSNKYRQVSLRERERKREVERERGRAAWHINNQ